MWTRIIHCPKLEELLKIEGSWHLHVIYIHVWVHRDSVKNFLSVLRLVIRTGENRMQGHNSRRHCKAAAVGTKNFLPITGVNRIPGLKKLRRSRRAVVSWHEEFPLPLALTRIHVWVHVS